MFTLFMTSIGGGHQWDKMLVLKCWSCTWCYNAGHVLGVAMFMIEITGVKVRH